MSEQIKQALLILTKYLRAMDDIPQFIEDEICALLGHDVKSGPEIPAGWERIEGECVAKPSEYIWLSGKWKKHVYETIRTAEDIVIRQTINIDLGKQPEELIAFAMDRNGIYYGFSDVPVWNGGIWSYEGEARIFMPSEGPTNNDGKQRNSLLVRPEAMNAPQPGSEK